MTAYKARREIGKSMEERYSSLLQCRSPISSRNQQHRPLDHSYKLSVFVDKCIRNATRKKL